MAAAAAAELDMGMQPESSASSNTPVLEASQRSSEEERHLTYDTPARPRRERPGGRGREVQRGLVEEDKERS